MSEWDDRVLDAEYDRYEENREQADDYEDELQEFEHEIGDVVANHPVLSNMDVLKILEEYVLIIKKRIYF